MKKTYTVLRDRFEHDDQSLTFGDDIELSDDAAAPLLTVGAIALATDAPDGADVHDSVTIEQAIDGNATDAGASETADAAAADADGAIPASEAAPAPRTRKARG